MEQWCILSYSFQRFGVNHKSGRKPKLSDCWMLKRIVVLKKKANTAKVTAELNQNPQHPVSTLIVRKELHNNINHVRIAIPKPLFVDVNAKCWLQLYHEHKSLSNGIWHKVIWSDESSLTLFSTSGHVYVKRTPWQTHDQHNLLSNIKHRGNGRWICDGLGNHLVLFFKPSSHLRESKGDDYIELLANYVHRMIETLFSAWDGIF